MDILLIVNPSSGGAGGDARDSVRERLASRGRVSVLEPSEEGFDADVTKAAEAAGLVAVAGGDGTFSRAVNALRPQLEDIVLALLPTGTGNDFARSLELPRDPLEAAEIAVSGVERSIDVGRALGGGVEKLFVNACIGGFPVAMDEAVDPGTKSRLGPLAFWAAGAKVAADLPRTTVTMNGVEVTECVAVGVGNGRTSGGGIAVWPRAALDDGLLDGCAMAAPNAAAAAKLAVKVKGGTHNDLDGVATTRAAKVVIESDPAIEINVDGELVGLTTPASFEIAGRARIMCPG